MSDILDKIKTAVVNRKRKEIEALVDEAINAGLEPDTIINKGLIDAMDVVGDQFSADEIFVPEMLASALTMKMGAGKGQTLTQENGPAPQRYHLNGNRQGGYARYRQKYRKHDA